MPYKAYSPIGAKFETATADQQFTLGTRGFGDSGSEWVYVMDSGSGVTDNYWVGIDEAFDATALTKTMADDGFQIGVAQCAVTADYYFWALIKGNNVDAMTAASTGADVAKYAGTVGGIPTSVSTDGTKIEGAVPVDANTLTTAAAVDHLITYPRSTSF